VEISIEPQQQQLEEPYAQLYFEGDLAMAFLVGESKAAIKYNRLEDEEPPALKSSSSLSSSEEYHPYPWNSDSSEADTASSSAIATPKPKPTSYNNTIQTATPHYHHFVSWSNHSWLLSSSDSSTGDHCALLNNDSSLSSSDDESAWRVSRLLCPLASISPLRGLSSRKKKKSNEDCNPKVGYSILGG
jgi:hypothetical protein